MGFSASQVALAKFNKIQFSQRLQTLLDDLGCACSFKGSRPCRKYYKDTTAPQNKGKEVKRKIGMPTKINNLTAILAQTFYSYF